MFARSRAKQEVVKAETARLNTSLDESTSARLEVSEEQSQVKSSQVSELEAPQISLTPFLRRVSKKAPCLREMKTSSSVETLEKETPVD